MEKIGNTNYVAKVCKIVAKIGGVCVFIGGLALGEFTGSWEFNTAIMLYVWIGGGVYCLFQYAVGEIIQLLADSNTLKMEMLKSSSTEIHLSMESSKNENLAKLEPLYKEGLITDEVYEARKKELENGGEEK